MTETNTNMKYQHHLLYTASYIAQNHLTGL